MKTQYEQPDAEMVIMVHEQNFLASGEDLETKSQGGGNTFWE